MKPAFLWAKTARASGNATRFTSFGTNKPILCFQFPYRSRRCACRACLRVLLLHHSCPRSFISKVSSFTFCVIASILSQPVSSSVAALLSKISVRPYFSRTSVSLSYNGRDDTNLRIAQEKAAFLCRITAGSIASDFEM